MQPQGARGDDGGVRLAGVWAGRNMYGGRGELEG